MNRPWKFSEADQGTTIKPGMTVNYVFKRRFIDSTGAKDPDELSTPAELRASRKAWERTKGEERTAITEEIDRRYWKGGELPEGTKIAEDDEAEAAVWKEYRHEVMQEKAELEKLPPELRELMGGAGSFWPTDYEQLLRIAGKLQQFSPEDITVYKMLALRATDDLNLFERSVDMFLARKAQLVEAMKKHEEEQKKSQSKSSTSQAPESMTEAIEGAWKDFDSAQVGKMSEADQYDLARRQTWEVTKAQLEYMKNNPGETAVDFAKTMTLMNTGDTFEGIGKDIAEAANGDANAWARWAGGIGAGAKLSGWLLAVGGMLYVLSWLTGVGELATIAAFMGAMLASTIVLSTAESELRIKAASKAKTPQEFQEQVTKAAVARTNVLVMVALLAIALAVRFVAKTYFPETVAKIKKSMAQFREKVRIKGKLSDIQAEFAKEMEAHRQSLVDAGEAAKKGSKAQADAVEAMTLDEFIEKLHAGSGDIFGEASVQQGQRYRGASWPSHPRAAKRSRPTGGNSSKLCAKRFPKRSTAWSKSRPKPLTRRSRGPRRQPSPTSSSERARTTRSF